MSFQAGLVKLAGDPVTPEEAELVIECVLSPFYAEPATLGGDGWFVAQAGGSPQSSTRTVLTFDGRLDNPTHPPLSAESVLKRFESEGLETLRALIGDWSLAIWDQTTRTLVLASDYAGSRPLYYSSQSQTVRWSTSLAPLIHSLDLDDDFIGAFLAFGGYPGRTPFRAIQTVPPGHAVEIAKSVLRVHSLWEAPIHRVLRYPNETLYEQQLLSLFAEAVRVRLPMDAAALCDLSGGLDSSSVVCMAKKLNTSRIVTYTFEHEGSLDERFYSAVEAHTGFEKVHLNAVDYPFLTESEATGALPAFWTPLHRHTAKVAAEIGASTYLTGQFGDWIMGNVWSDTDQVAGLLRAGRVPAAFAQALQWSKLLRIPIWWVLGRAFLSSLPASLVPTDLYGHDQGSYAHKSTEDSISSSIRKRLGLHRRENFFSKSWIEARPEKRKYIRGLLETFGIRKLQPPEPLQHLSYTHPFTHRPLVEFMLSIPAEMVCGPGEPRRLQRRAFRSLWPPGLEKRRSKDSFGGVFLESLRLAARQLLAGGGPYQVAERGFVDPASFIRRLGLMTHSLDCNESQLRQIMLLELWLRNLTTRGLRGFHP